MLIQYVIWIVSLYTVLGWNHSLVALELTRIVQDPMNDGIAQFPKNETDLVNQLIYKLERKFRKDAFGIVKKHADTDLAPKLAILDLEQRFRGISESLMSHIKYSPNHKLKKRFWPKRTLHSFRQSQSSVTMGNATQNASR